MRKAGHKSLVLPLKCLEGSHSLVQEADSHVHYEELKGEDTTEAACLMPSSTYKSHNQKCQDFKT